MNKPSNTHIVCATSDCAKALETSGFLRFHGFETSALSELRRGPIPKPITSDQSLGQNAISRAEACAEAIAKICKSRGERAIVIGDDTGIFIPSLDGEPGIRVRDWIGREMTDEEIIKHALGKLEHHVGARRSAHLRTVMCLMFVNHRGQLVGPAMFEGELSGTILEAPSEVSIPGNPFSSIFYVDGWDVILAHLHQMDFAARSQRPLSKEQALGRALPTIRDLMAN